MCGGRGREQQEAGGRLGGRRGGTEEEAASGRRGACLAARERTMCLTVQLEISSQDSCLAAIPLTSHSQNV